MILPLVLGFAANAFTQPSPDGKCAENSNGLYYRQKTLQKFEDILKASVPLYSSSPHIRSSLIGGFFIVDLIQPSNRFISNIPKSRESENCITFDDGHIYHFSPSFFDISESHIAFLKNGDLEVFESVNCEYQNDNLSKALTYANEFLKNDERKNEALVRLNNYRRYAHYRTVDGYRVTCNYDKEIPQNSDKLYSRESVLDQFADVLRGSLAENTKEQYSWWFSIEEGRSSGFFVWDLTEPSNKQTSLLERVEFKNDHVYHFAFIDAPFSFSNIAVLEDGKLKLFRTINCARKGETLQDAVIYLDRKLQKEKNKNAILDRVKNYRDFGVYVAYQGLSTPQCNFVKPTSSKGIVQR